MDDRAPTTRDAHEPAPPDGSEPSAEARPQSPASKGLRGGLVVALAAALLTLAANESFLLPSMDAEGVAHFYAAASLAAGEGARVPVVHWSASDTTSALDGPTVVPQAMAALIAPRIRTHVAAVWFLAGSLALLVLTVGWVAGGAAGVEGGLLAGALVLVSPLALEVGTALRPEALAAALVTLQMGAMTYRPRWHLAHGAAGALAWAVHPAGAGALAAAVLWPLLPDAPPLGPGLPAGAAGRGRGARLAEAGLALAPGLLLLFLGPTVQGLPSLPPVVAGAPSAAPLVQLVGWAGAGVAGLAGLVLGLGVLAAVALLVVAEALATPPVDPTVPWYHPRTPDLVAGRARAAGWLVTLGVGLGGMAAGGGAELERTGLLLVAPVAVLAGLAARRWIEGAAERPGWILAGVVGLWLALSGWNAVERSRETREDGRGLTTAAWLQSPTVRWLDNRVPDGFPIYASVPYTVLMQTGRAARTLPADDDSIPAFAEHFQHRPGPIVLAGADTARAPAFASSLGLVPVVQGPQGWILVPGPGGTEAPGPPGGG